MSSRPKSCSAASACRCPRGKWPLRPRRPPQAFRSARQPKAVIKAQIHAGGRGKAGGVKLMSSADEARDIRRPAARQTAGDASDRARGPRGAPRLCRGGEPGRARALPRHGGRSQGGGGRGNREHRGRHGDRRGRGQDARKDPHRSGRPAARDGAVPGAPHRVRAGAEGQAGRPVRDPARRALPRLRRDRRLARRDQPAGA